MTVWTVASVLTAVLSHGATMPKTVSRSGIAAKRLRVIASSATAAVGLGEIAGTARYSSSLSVPASGLRERALLPLSKSRIAWTAFTSGSGSAYGRTCSCARSSSLDARTIAARTCTATAATSANPGMRADAPVMRLMCDEARSAATLASVSHACACSLILSLSGSPDAMTLPSSSSVRFEVASPWTASARASAAPCSSTCLRLSLEKLCVDAASIARPECMVMGPVPSISAGRSAVGLTARERATHSFTFLRTSRMLEQGV